QEGSTLPKSELVGAGVVTSSSGITVYRGDAYPPAYRDFAFVADVAGNLFYRMKLVPDGVTFKAVQVDGQKNFCTGDDLWFRPVNFVNAPDGCLHVCDMYREVIEHPWSIPDDIHASLDLLRGRDKGRLWRLAPAAFKNRPTPKLSNATTNELVALLDHPNAWHRETAQRLLFERQDKAAVEPLRDLVKNGKTPQGQAAALWTLQSLPFVPEANHTPLSGLGALSDALLNDVLEKSQNNDVVKQALFVALKFFEHRAPSEIGSVDLTISRLSRYHKDLGAMLLPFAMTLNLRVAEADRDCMLATVRTALADTFAKRSIIPPIVSVDRISELVFLLSQRTSPIRSSNDSIDFCEVLSIAGAPDTLGSLCDVPRIVEQYRRQTTDDSQGPIQTPESFAAAIARGMSSRHLALADLNLPPPSAAWWDTFASSRLDKLDQDLSHLTIDDLSLVAITRAPKGLDILARCIANLQTPDLQLAALEALGSYQLPAVADILIDSWPQLTPVLRDKATTLLLSRTDRIAKLLDAIEAKRITPAQLSIAAKATLGRQKTPALAERIARLIGDGAASNRAGVIAQYTAALSLTGDAAQGAKVYEAACMVCHRHKDRGNDVGPNLGTIKAWTAEQILTNILDPNREVSPNFALYVVETKDGRTLSGLIASETAGNLTLRRADGGTDSILRSEIRSLTSPGTSLMPEGLEAAITPQQMADLMAWLRAD
ncbi:MAG: c-type cytochrome, partial [Verrucomicrobiales bacterium]|nr:c-type cytochrome [Verrucomicrobiales bacterium]